MTKLEETKAILKAFGCDETRYNDRGGRTLLALTQLTESDSWTDAKNPMYLSCNEILHVITESARRRAGSFEEKMVNP